MTDEKRTSGMTRTPYKRAVPKVQRNQPCPCDSGRKYKHCCIELATVAERQAREYHQGRPFTPGQKTGERI